MAKPKQGDKVDNQEPKLDPANGVQPAQNEFAPNVINDGGEQGAREVLPAPTPEASLQNDPGANAPDEDEEQAAPEDQLSDEQRQALAIKERNREFVTYVNGELSDVAEELGYERLVLKPKAVAVARGPVMMYHRVTEEGKVFPNALAAGDDYISGDELNARRAAKAE